MRRQINAETNDGAHGAVHQLVGLRAAPQAPGVADQLRGRLRHPPEHPSATTLAAKRAAARAIVDPRARQPPRRTPEVPARRPAGWTRPTSCSAPATGANADGVTITGLDDVDLWVGGLAEVTNLFGGLLGSTFNYVFQTQMESLQDGDRFYYLTRTPGMNLRTQLEGNSFAEMIQRNTDGHRLAEG